MIRIVLADDHHLVRQGIRSLLEKSGDMQVVGEAEDGQQAIELAERLKPDILVADIGMPRMNGIRAAEKLRSLNSKTRVLILSMHSSELLIRKALLAGAKGYLLKISVTEELLQALRTVYSGQIYLSPPVSSVMTEAFISGRSPGEVSGPLDQLTDRELEVLQLIAEGHTSQAIAQLLNTATGTIERHRSNLMNKLDVHDVAGLTRLAIQYGLIFLDQ